MSARARVISINLVGRPRAFRTGHSIISDRGVYIIIMYIYTRYTYYYYYFVQHNAYTRPICLIIKARDQNAAESIIKKIEKKKIKTNVPRLRVGYVSV